MEATIDYGPGNAAAKVSLAPGETFTAEGGAMIAMSGDMSIETTTHKKGSGGILKAAKRMLAGESFFLNHFTAGPDGGEVWLATTLAGDMMQYDLKGDTLVVQGGSYVASEPGVKIDLGWQGFKSLLSGESMFWLHLSGAGKVILNSFGAIYPVEVAGDHIVDTGHIVAFNETLDFKITKAGKSWISSILGGEGLVCRFHGQGTVWCQSHNAVSFGTTLGRMLRPR
jgi:uncharacterized protein (TIGR00266 family)